MSQREVQVIVRWDAMQESEVGRMSCFPWGSSLWERHTDVISTEAEAETIISTDTRPIPDPNGPAWPCRDHFPPVIHPLFIVIQFNQPTRIFPATRETLKRDI